VDYQRLLIDHLDLINRIARTTGRRRHLSATEQEEFESRVRYRLVENEYAILRKFQGRSSLWTYLAAVIDRMSFDYCDEIWGRWRPTRTAERLGDTAVALERLVSHGHPLDEAMEILRSGNGGAPSHAELHRIWEQLPARQSKDQVEEQAADELAAPDTSDANVVHQQRQRDLGKLQGALSAAFGTIAEQDRVLIALRFDQDLSITEIARIMGSSVPTLHRRLAAAVSHLRVALAGAGFKADDVADLIGHASLALPPLLRAEAERFLDLVRLSK
jgi:RNA polymerase sigma factor for flagellar operon FliA